MAAILQGKPSVFETDQFPPLIELGEELSGSALRRGLRGRPRAADPRRPRPRDDLPDRRRRRALQRGSRLRAAPGDAPRDPAGPRARARARASSSRYAERVRELMGGAYPELHEHARRDRHVARRRGGGLRAHARAGHGDAARATSSARARRGARRSRPRRSSACTTPTASRIEMTQRAARRGGPRDRGRLRGADGASSARAAAPARVAARGRAAPARARARERVRRREPASPTRFTGYETERAADDRRASSSPRTASADGDGAGERYLVKLAESPFYAAGGGQVADVGDDRVRATATAARASQDVVPARRRPGARTSSLEQGELHDGRARARARRPRRAPRHRVQPHRHPPAAGGAARARSAATCARPAPTSAPTSCASTSATARR